MILTEEEIGNGYTYVLGDLMDDGWEVFCDLYHTHKQAAYELGKLFMSKVTPSDRDEFEKMLEAHMEVLVAGMEESYASGFCDGVKLIIEALGR